jgi:O-antigen/teichoic acid export membrane protein
LLAKNSVVKSSLMLTAASGVEFLLQLAVPMVFVRHLSPELFSQYRFLWLLAATLLAFVPAYMPQALFYFLPRSLGLAKTVRVTNVIVYLVFAGGLAAVILSPFNPLVTGSLRQVSVDSDFLVLMFFWLWMIVSINQTLPVCEGKVLWQASTDVVLALVRTALLVCVAIVAPNFKAIVVALLIDAFLRAFCLLVYLFRRGDKPVFSFDLATTVLQLKYSLPFAAGSGLFALRSQLDQWIVALICGPHLLALFAIGAVLLPLSALVKQPLYSSNLPRVSAAFAASDFDLVKVLIYRGVCYTVLFLVPTAIGFFLVSKELIQVIYTDRYLMAVPVMRLYLLGIGFSAIGVSYVLPALELGRFSVKNNCICLLVSCVVGFLGASLFGTIGAALGSVSGLVVSEFWSLHKVSRLLHVSVFELIPFRFFALIFIVSVICCYISFVVSSSFVTVPVYALFAKGSIYAGLLVLAALVYWISTSSTVRKAF